MNERVKEWVLFNCNRRVTLKLQKPENGNVIPLNGKMGFVCAYVYSRHCHHDKITHIHYLCCKTREEKRREKANFNDTISIKYCDAKCTTMRRKNRSEPGGNQRKGEQNIVFVF